MGNWRKLIFSRKAIWRMAILVGIVALLCGGLGVWMFAMPGKSYHGPLVLQGSDLSRELERHVRYLSEQVGRRGVFKPEAYQKAEEYIEQQLKDWGYAPQRQMYEVEKVPCANIEVELPGKSKPEQILVIGAHYDTVEYTPGANDNGSGVAGMLALAHRLKKMPLMACTVRLVAFANEEPPYFQTPQMGSYVYAQRCRSKGEKIIGMLSLETIGYYNDEEGTQRYPPPFNRIYPATGNFIAFVGNFSSRRWVRRVIGSFRQHCQMPSEGGSIPEYVTGVGWSDQWSFWQMGYPALMVTDTAPFRYRAYHTRQDRAENLDYWRMARVVECLLEVVIDLS